MNTLFSFLLSISLLSCQNQPVVKNIIYIIGDGMGIGQTTSMVLNTAPEDTYIKNKDISVGLATTHSADSRVTDSAAGGTALATGFKTDIGHVSISPKGDTLTSILLQAKDMGKSTGIIVSTALFDATPAAFYGNVSNRFEWEDLALQLTRKDVDLIMGDGIVYMNRRSDSLDLIEVLKEKGYQVTENFGSVLQTESCNKLAAFIDLPALMEPCDGTDYLTLAAQKGLQLMEKRNNPNGFFLMIESSRIDHFGHDNDASGLEKEMIKFNYLAQEAIKFAQNHPGTLVVITADHETGGFSVYEDGEYKFCAEGHSGNMVPVFAYGPGSEQFARIMDNVEIPRVISNLAGFSLPDSN
jgi:alkaline phosphatase